MGAEAKMTFYKWLHDVGLVGMTRREIDLMEEAWNAADRAAREECELICKYREIACAFEQQNVQWAIGAKQCADAIRASITGESRQPEKRD